MEPHPRGVQPFGCRLLLGASAADVRASGLGSLAALPDALVMDVLGRLQGAGLAALSCCSRAAAAFCAPEELWRSLALQLFADAGSTVVFTPPGWRSSYAAAAAAATRGRPPPAPSSAARTSVDETGQAAAAPAGGGADGVPPVRCPGLYSDLLYAPHLAAFTPLLPSWLAGESVPRAAAASLTRAAFELAYEAPGLPVLLTGAVAAWPASASWLAGGALAREPLASAPVVAGGHAFAMADYLRYADAVRHDDSPLYLFDRDVLFATSLGGDVELQPHPFGPDLFDLLGGHGDPGRRAAAWGEGAARERVVEARERECGVRC